MKFDKALETSIKLLGSTEFKERANEEDPTMIKHFPILQQINRQGFLTTNSQAGRYHKGKHYQTGKPYEISERAYIDGFLHESKVEEFIKQMALKTDKIAVYIPSCSTLNIPSKYDVPLTVTTTDGKTTVTTHMSLAIPTDVLDFFKKEAHINKSERVAYIFAWDPMWNRDASGKKGLFTEVLQILRIL